MRYQAYISVLGSEREVRAIHADAAIPESSIKHYVKVTAKVSPTGQDAPWGWGTARVRVPESDPDSGIRDLLERYHSLDSVIGKYRQQNTYVCLTLIAQQEKGDDQRGLWLSSKTLSLLVRLGAAFEIDVVSLME